MIAPNTEIQATLGRLHSLLTTFHLTLNTLTVQIGTVDFVAQVGELNFSHLVGLGGAQARRMPNLNSDIYTVLEIMGLAGATCLDYRIPQQVSTTIMRGRIRFKVEDEDWIECDPVTNSNITFAPNQRRSYEVIEDVICVSIFTPPLP